MADPIQGTLELVFELRTTASSRLALANVRGRFTSDGLEAEGTVGDRDPSDSSGPLPRRARLIRLIQRTVAA